MTTYRRFCCNDLLRFGSLTLKPDIITHQTNYYLLHLVYWPGSCHVADGPGGRMVGYILGFFYEWGRKHTGRLSVLSWDLIDAGKKLANLLEDGYEKIFKAHRMKVIVSIDNPGSQNIFKALGYEKYKVIPGYWRMKKLLPGGLNIERRLRPSSSVEYEPQESCSTSSSQDDLQYAASEKFLAQKRSCGSGFFQLFLQIGIHGDLCLSIASFFFQFLVA